MRTLLIILALLFAVDAQAACNPTSATTQSCSNELSWTWTPFKDATGFVVQRKIDDAVWSDFRIIPLTERTLVDVIANDTGGRTISYQIMFYNDKGRSLPSNTVSAGTPVVTGSISAPTNLVVFQ